MLMRINKAWGLSNDLNVFAFLRYSYLHLTQYLGTYITNFNIKAFSKRQSLLNVTAMYFPPPALLVLLLKTHISSQYIPIWMIPEELAMERLTDH